MIKKTPTDVAQLARLREMNLTVRSEAGQLPDHARDVLGALQGGSRFKYFASPRNQGS